MVHVQAYDVLASCRKIISTYQLVCFILTKINNNVFHFAVDETPDITFCVGSMYVMGADGVTVEDFVETSCDFPVNNYTKYTNLHISRVGVSKLFP